MGSYISYLTKLTTSTVQYMYQGTLREVPFSTSNTNNLMSEEEYKIFMDARDYKIRRWSRMYSDSFLESEYRYDPVIDNNH